ncbi:MAG: N-acetylmuramoyl-L-alanine amidase [Pseudomonadota bacterium]
MLKTKLSKILICFLLLSFCACFLIPSESYADSAKQRYLEADTCYKKLRNSETKRNKASEWLNCIKLYETIYTVYPNSSWAPAGMFKAAELYVTLSRLSGSKRYEDQAIDLLERIKNRYPKSAYFGRARSFIQTIAQSSTPPAPKPPTPDHPPVEPKHILSTKEQTKNDSLINTYLQAQQDHQTKLSASEPDQIKPNQIKPEPTPQVRPPELSTPNTTDDTTITELRFWSNPEYTRIVVNAENERNFSHRLLKKDPDIDKPFQRLYIDIEQSRLGEKIAEHTPINDELLKQARAGQYLPHTVRVVVDIKSFENYKIFSLKDPFRIIIDVWGKGANGGSTKPEDTTVATVVSPEETTPEKMHQFTTDNLESSDIARQLALGVRKIVIDPGHGGSDPGAPGYFKDVWEKDIVLKLAKKLAVTLRDRLKCTVVLTRSKDIKLTLEERTAMANTQRADLFISLHCNAARNRKLTGIETYILNLATDSQAIAVAARENATSEKNISDLEYILSDLMKHAKIEESTRLANVVHASFVDGMKKNYSDINNLGVKRAPFYVLLGARMPSILVETSFLSNKTECKRLMSDSYQTNIANSIADGVEKYIQATNPKQF